MRDGKKVDDFSDAEADNYIEFNGIKSELVIVEAEVQSWKSIYIDRSDSI